MKHATRKPVLRQKFDPAVRDFLDAVAEIITKQLLQQHEARTRGLRAAQSEGPVRDEPA